MVNSYGILPSKNKVIVQAKTFLALNNLMSDNENNLSRSEMLEIATLTGCTKFQSFDLTSIKELIRKLREIFLVTINSLSQNHNDVHLDIKPLLDPADYDRSPITTNHQDPKNEAPNFSDITCQFCQQYFSNRETFQDHETNCTNSQYDYGVNKKEFSENDDNVSLITTKQICAFKNEKGRHYEFKKIDYNCLHSESKLRIKNVFKKHKENKRSVDGSKETFQCSICEKVFDNKYYLRKHEYVHNDKKKYVCDMCGKSFNQNSGLYTHKKLHLDRHPFKCTIPECGKAFTTKNSLTSHSTEHSGIKPFVCEVCGKSFGNRRTLLRHRELHFEIRKSFNCSHCNKAFRRKSDVEIHERIHTGLKPFVCSFSCGKAFAQKQSLTEHERIHKGERPYVCTICGRAFTQKSTLTKHKRTHKSVPSLLSPSLN